MNTYIRLEFTNIINNTRDSIILDSLSHSLGYSQKHKLACSVNLTEPYLTAGGVDVIIK